jgi:hypothetical protein
MQFVEWARTTEHRPLRTYRVRLAGQGARAGESLVVDHAAVAVEV